jgi:hypothetical protein
MKYKYYGISWHKICVALWRGEGEIRVERWVLGHLSCFNGKKTMNNEIMVF